MAEWISKFPKIPGLYNCLVDGRTETVLQFWIDEMSPKKRGWRDPETFALVGGEISYQGDPLPDGGGEEPAGGGVMYVYYTPDESSEEEGVFNSDKTFPEIAEAIESGRQVIAVVFDFGFLPVTSFQNNEEMGGVVFFSGSFVSVDSANGVAILSSDTIEHSRFIDGETGEFVESIQYYNSNGNVALIDDSQG